MATKELDAGQPYLSLTIDGRNARWAYDRLNQATVWQAEAYPEQVSAAIKQAASDPASGFKAYLELAEKGSVWSMAAVAKAYRIGLPVSQDLKISEQWYKRSIAGGSDWSLLQLAQIYSRSKRYSEAEQLLSEGASKNIIPAISALAFLYVRFEKTERFHDAIRLFKMSSSQGDLWAEQQLIRLLIFGRLGVAVSISGLLRIPKFLFRTTLALRDELNQDHNSNVHYRSQDIYY